MKSGEELKISKEKDPTNSSKIYIMEFPKIEKIAQL